jgi:hypothetical protein
MLAFSPLILPEFHGLHGGCDCAFYLVAPVANTPATIGQTRKPPEHSGRSVGSFGSERFALRSRDV